MSVPRIGDSPVTRGTRSTVKLALALVLGGCSPVITSFEPEEGPVGTEVTITGKRFGSAPADNTVKFGEVEATEVTIPSENTIVAKVPAGARTGVISVTTSRGTGYSERNFIVPTEAKWTVMIYLDADNNLEGAGLDDFLEMAAVGSSPELNIVVQMDRIAGNSTAHGDWMGARRFYIEANDTPGMTPLTDLGELNMGDPAVLQDFVEWAVTTYPADHYALSIWNHGGGWRVWQERLATRTRTARASGDTADLAVARAVAWDETDGNDPLYMREVQDALAAARSNLETRSSTQVKLDIVGFDACLMGMIEVAYALRDVANFVVASEHVEPGDGWPYDDILENLVATPTMGSEDLASLIVTEYHQSYPGGSLITQSAVDVSKLGAVVSRIDAFTLAAIADWAELAEARANTLEYHLWYVPDSYWGVDLWDFADEVYNRVGSAATRLAAQELKKALDEFVVKELHSTDMDGSHGIAVYFPATVATFNSDPDHTGYMQDNNYMPVDFVRQHRWDEWLQTFYTGS